MAKITDVLVTDMTSYKAAVVARFIKHLYPRLRIVSTDHRPISRWLRSRWSDRHFALPVGPEAGRAYAEAVADVLRKTGAGLLIPINSREIAVLMQHREQLGEPYAYAGDAAVYGQLDDKAAFAQLLERLGLPQPRAHTSLDAVPPLVLKPVRGSSAQGVVYLHDEEAIAEARMELGVSPSGYVIQDYVDGEGVGYSGYFDKGQIAVGYAHRRVAEYPVAGGSSVVRESYPYGDAGELASLVERVLAAAPWSGFAMFELKRRPGGGFVFIECNPRIWGSIHQGLVNGVNYFEPLLGPSGVRMRPADYRTELFPLSWLSLVGYVRCGRMGIVRDIVSGWTRTRLDINPFSDPLGFLALLARRP